MWAATDVCDPNDPTPSIFGYIYSHNQQTSLDANGQIHGGILSVSFHDLAGIWVAFFSRGMPAVSLLPGAGGTYRAPRTSPHSVKPTRTTSL